ncbi:MAG TPA: aryl-sulfate sulfotransferase [Bryobacteraceae bacterium]|nr:aryl-sulfate sulfotransferase [Bryobacteraceae bacterium]
MPALATVQIQSLTPSLNSPQVIGTTIQWTVTATDTNTGPLTFQFSVAPPGGSMAMVKDFNVGTYSSGMWTAQIFAWTSTGVEGAYQIQVVAKDFGSKETNTSSIAFQVNPLVTGGTPVVVATANPLVALFSAPPCASGSKMRVKFATSQPPGGTLTSWLPCNGSTTMTFEIAGMYPSTGYKMFSQTDTGGVVVNGPAVSFKTGALPANAPIPKFVTNVAADSNTDTNDRVILAGLTMPGQIFNYPEVATDLSGNIIWYYYPPSNVDLIARPLSNGILIIESGPAWNAASNQFQLLRHIDWAGNIVKETNTGAIQQQLLALGATDARPCDAISRPAPVGAGCLDDFDHDFIRTLPNGYSALLADTEKIYPPGTQGDTSGLPVDIIGNMIVVLDRNWQVKWYFDAFEHATGAPQLDITRSAVLHETCGVNQLGCPPAFLLGSGIAPLAFDWLHGNSLYYWPAPRDGSTQGDLIWSSRHQDWVMRVDYKDGTGTGNILWRMGLDGDFQFNNINNDPWPWFSHQHEADIESTTRYLTLFDNGNTRFDQIGGDSRGMALKIDESNMEVTPALSVDLGVYSSAVGSAQLLGNSNYYFMAGFVGQTTGYSIEIFPAAGTTTGTEVFNLSGTVSYRAWRMTSLYTPPIS